jgi:hypothetical protein
MQHAMKEAIQATLAWTIAWFNLIKKAKLRARDMIAEFMN